MIPRTDPLLAVGDQTVQLVERLYDMGCAPPTWGRIKGTRRVWVNAELPDGRQEAEGHDLDTASLNFIALYLTCPDKQRDRAQWKEAA